MASYSELLWARAASSCSMIARCAVEHAPSSYSLTKSLKQRDSSVVAFKSINWVKSEPVSNSEHEAGMVVYGI